jgi:O-acetyl-ADP-ribose deacetylase (regulator of RNase III)
MGKEVYRSVIGSDVFSLDLSSFPAGVYAVKLSSAAHVKTRTVEILK